MTWTVHILTCSYFSPAFHFVLLSKLTFLLLRDVFFIHKLHFHHLNFPSTSQASHFRLRQRLTDTGVGLPPSLPLWHLSRPEHFPAHPVNSFRPRLTPLWKLPVWHLMWGKKGRVADGGREREMKANITIKRKIIKMSIRRWSTEIKTRESVSKHIANETMKLHTFSFGDFPVRSILWANSISAEMKAEADGSTQHYLPLKSTMLVATAMPLFSVLGSTLMSSMCSLIIMYASGSRVITSCSVVSYGVCRMGVLSLRCMYIGR